MVTMEMLRNEHIDVFKRIQLWESSQIHFLQETRDQYPVFVRELSEFFKTGLAYHFKVEEEALFPVLKNKVEPSIIQNLLFDHERIIKEFRRFELVEDFDLSVQILKSLINYLKIHAQKEEDFFSSVNLSDEEVKQVDAKAKLVELRSGT
jgi:iron-sulfur cluster repair protein YtfE (RIC family)